jgi:hypothetical protein
LVKAKGKEKEFLVPVAAVPGNKQSGRSGKEKEMEKEKEKERPPVTILRRPDPEPQPRESVFSEEEDDSEGHGGKTPTHFGSISGAMQKSIVASLDGSSSSTLMGKKGWRVGRKERDREKTKIDLMKGRLGVGTGTIEAQLAPGVGEDFGNEHDDGDEDDEDDNLEPQEEEEEEENVGDPTDPNDSLAGMSLLQPPRRRRSRSRRRKGRDTAYIHNLAGITGAYKSTPPTPGRVKSIISDELEELSKIGKASADDANGNEVDVFGSKPNEGAGGEKRKRTRTKRVKALTHSTSDPQLKADAKVGEKPVELEEDNDNASVKTAKPKKGKNKTRSAEDEEGILDMDRNQLSKLISESARVGSRLLLSGGQPLEPPPQPAPDSKRGRLLTLARKLRQLFPEQHEELGRVIARIEGTETTAKTRLASDANRSKVVPIPVGKKKKSSKGGHMRIGSEGTGGEGFEFDDEDDAQGIRPIINSFPDIEEEDEEIDPRGRPPKKGDVLVHVFVDQYVF